MRKLIHTSLIAVLLSVQSLASVHAAAPSVPTGITVVNASIAGAAMDAAQAQVSWSEVIGALGYTITYSALNQAAKSKTVVPGTTTSTVIDSLLGGVEYTFVVASKNLDGESAATGVKFIARSIPSAPMNGTFVAASGQVTLSWTAPSNLGGFILGNYTITAIGFAGTTALGTETSKVIPGLTAGAKYDFKIRASNEVGNSEIYNFSTATVPDRPKTPTTLTASVAGSTITARWQPPTDNGGSAITSYSAYLYDAAGLEIPAYKKVNITGTTVDFTGVGAGTYTIKVAALNIVGESDKTAASDPQVIATVTLAANTPTILPTTIADLGIDSTLEISATAPSAGTVTLSVSPSGVCSYSSLTQRVTGVGVGTCTITAEVPASGAFAIGSVPKNFNVVKVSQRITLVSVSSQTAPGSVTITASASSGQSPVLTVSGTCSISGAVVSFTTSGSCTVKANAAATSKYLVAPEVTSEFNIAAGSGGTPGGISGGTSGGTPYVPLPTPTPTPSATPIPTPSATPTPTPTATPTPSASPSATPKPVVAPSSTFKATPYLSVAPLKMATTKISLKSAAASLTIAAGKAISVTIPSVAKGAAIVVTMKTPDGKSITIASVKTKKVGNYQIPALALKKPGTYLLTIKIGKSIKTVKVKVTK